MKHYTQPTLEEDINQIKFYYMWEPIISFQPKMPTKLSKVIKLVNIWKRINVKIIVSEIVSHEDDLNAKGKAVNKCKFNKVRFLEN